VSNDTEKGKSIEEIIEKAIDISEEMRRGLRKAVQDSAASATLLLDYLGIRGQEREIAEGLIEIGEKEAERISVFFVARQMKHEEKWRWITLGMSLASLVVAVIAVIVSLVT